MENGRRGTAFFAAGVWSGPVNDYDAPKRNPQFKSYFVTYEHPRAGPVTTTAPSICFSGQSGLPIRGAPALGEHTAEILAQESSWVGNMADNGVSQH